jgi:hypothetical protein
MFLRAHPHGSASIAALAGGEHWANRQVCPTFVGSSGKMRPTQNGDKLCLDTRGFMVILACSGFSAGRKPN